MGSPGDRREKAQSKKRILLLGACLAVVVVTLIVAVAMLLRGGGVVSQVALKVGDRKVTYAQLDEYTVQGKKVDASASDVRASVIEYEKNLQMAEKYNIAMPDTYVYAQNGYDDQSRGNLYIKISKYNREFEARLLQQALSGYGVLLYDLPVHPEAADQDTQKLLDKMKLEANRFRSQIVDDKQSPLEALREVSKYNANNGQSSQTGVRFIVDDETSYDDSNTGSVSSDRYLLSQIKGKKPGVTEVQVSGGYSVFFVDILFEQKQQGDIIDKVKKDKASMGVVEYDV